jgi:hypothetical protein
MAFVSKPRSPVKQGRWLRLSLFAIGAYLVGCIFAGILQTEGALRPGRRPVVHRPEAAALVAREFGATLEDAEAVAADGVQLRGWFARPANSNGRAVVLLHGVSDNREGMAGYALLFLRHGFSVLLPDARAHGDSGGELATYGVLEGADLGRWVAWLREDKSMTCVYGLGESMGAALVLESLRERAAFCAVAAESAFSSFREIAYDRLGQRFGAGDWLGRTLFRPIVEVGMVYARWRHGLDLEQASPRDAVAGTSVPVLLIHGEKDDNIPPRHSEEIHARRPAGTILWVVPNAGHGGAVGEAKEEFERRLVTLFQETAKAEEASPNFQGQPLHLQE